MKRYKSFVLLTILASFVLTSCGLSEEQCRKRIDLAGYWSYKFHAEDTYSDSLALPGTTDTNKKGILNTQKNVTRTLSRTYQYRGKVWYQKDVTIPTDWKEKEIFLLMERTKPSEVYVDQQLVGSSTDITTAQQFNLSNYLNPGQHTLTIVINNAGGVPYQVMANSHAYTESTQTNWNGIIGDFYLEATDKCHIKDIQVYPDYASRKARVTVNLCGTADVTDAIEIVCNGKTWNTPMSQKITPVSQKVNPGDSVCSLVLDLGDDAAAWSEFHPALYRLSVSLHAGQMKDNQTADFGLRTFTTRGKQFVINDKTTFLRGKHDACVFPLTGHTSMNVDEWRHYFQVAKSYGINHYRFHSWCPPEACFTAADIEGIYLQPELPFWGGFRAKDSTLISFLYKEGINIQKAYSNHASFVMFALGNEVSGEPETIRNFIQAIHKTESRHLFAYGSNNFLGFKGQQEGEDYLTTCRVGKDKTHSSYLTHARASFSFADAADGGYLNHTYPNTVMNFDSAVARCTVPIISHETGQFQMYPDFKEMAKYTGVLEPRNFTIFKQRLADAGMLDQAEDFFQASGKWAAELYRAEIEMDLRTRNFGGFQLLDLQDYPGQGTALVGILNAFMESKGLVTPEKWHESCSEVVPLFESSSYTHTTDQNLRGKICVANYSENTLHGILNWKLKYPNGEFICKGEMPFNAVQGDVTEIGQLDYPLSIVEKAKKCTLTLSINNTSYKNEYPVWIYPSEFKTTSTKVLLTHALDAKAMSTLKKGKRVLWFPNASETEGVTVGGLFQTDYWNYSGFKRVCEGKKVPVSPGTLGLLIQSSHPLFQQFPTENHSNWQWFPIVKQSHPMILDQTDASYRPIVQVIDNIDRNHKLGLVYELNVEGGKLLVCMADLMNVQDKPEVNQFLTALISYAESEDFNPTYKLSEKGIRLLFSSQKK